MDELLKLQMTETSKLLLGVVAMGFLLRTNPLPRYNALNESSDRQDLYLDVQLER